MAGRSSSNYKEKQMCDGNCKCGCEPKRPYCASADECDPLNVYCSDKFNPEECPLAWDNAQIKASRASKPLYKAVQQADPNDIPQHAPGAKLDKGKPRVGMMFASFPDALMAVAEVATFGADKYTDFGWEQVHNALIRYLDAAGRHFLKSARGVHDKKFVVDEESGVNELAHLAWNVLAVLQKSIVYERDNHE